MKVIEVIYGRKMWWRQNLAHKGSKHLQRGFYFSKGKMQLNLDIARIPEIPLKIENFHTREEKGLIDVIKDCSPLRVTKSSPWHHTFLDL